MGGDILTHAGLEGVKECPRRGWRASEGDEGGGGGRAMWMGEEMSVGSS
jgi:hypothetical protein